MGISIGEKYRVSQFQRPSEGVVYFTVENLCQEQGGQCAMPLAKLAQHCGLAVSTASRAVLALAKQGLIQYRRGYNQTRPSLFALSYTQRKIGAPNPNDSDPVNIYTGDNDIGKLVHKQNEESKHEPVNKLAYRVADGLGDLKNLALYMSYCRRFPQDIILKAFVRAREVEPNKIKKSRGALFNYLCQKMYAK